MAMTATATLSLGPTVLAVTPIFWAGADGAGYDSSLRGHARMKLQTRRNDLSYTNAPFCAQQLSRFFLFLFKKSTLKSNLQRTTSTV